MIEEIIRCTIDEEIKLFAIPQGIEEGYEVLVEINLLDKDRNILKTILPKGVKVEKNIDKEKYGDSENIILCKFVINELSKDIKVEEVKYVTGWIDSNDDKELSIEYDEVSVLEVSHELITKEMLYAICPNFKPTDDFMIYINQYALDFEINTTIRIAHFLSQISVESDCFTALKERLNYTAENIRNIWGYLKDKQGKFVLDEKGNKVKKRTTMTYNQTTVDLWNDKSISQVTGDSKFANWRYGYINKQGKIVNHRGRGYIHITWKNNYEAYTNYYQKKYNDLTIDFVENPELLEILPYSLESSFHFWQSNNLNNLADSASVIEITKKVNGGSEGLSKREKNFKIIINLIKG